MTAERTQVAIVGAGPAGLLLAHLLAQRGIDTIAVDGRTRAEIEHTHRAGILESQAVRMLTETGVSDRVLRDGYEHRGIELRFNGHGHRIDFQDLVGESVWLYPQTDVFIDLADARERDGGDVRFGVSEVTVEGAATATPVVRFVDAEGQSCEVTADYVVGADGSRSYCRGLVPEDRRKQYFREYPFAWLGILAEAPMSAPELIYAHSHRGFALISQRTPTVQRMYLQCSPGENLEEWSDDRIWDELIARTAGDGFELQTGPIFEKSVLVFRSFVQEGMRHGHVLLAGDAAHTVPPTGAKGLNLAFADVRVLAEVLGEAIATADDFVLATYAPRALSRVWKAENFSWWMTQMLHTPQPAGPSAKPPGIAGTDGVDFDARRQIGELESVVHSRHGSAYLAEAYTGWPS